MLPQHAPAPQSPRRIGVGIDTSRYGHYAVFLTRRPPARRRRTLLPRVRRRLRPLPPTPRKRIVQRYGAVHFVVRLDVAGPVCRQPAPLPAPTRPRRQPTPANAARRWPSPSPAAIRNATRTTAPPSSAARSPIPSRPAPPHASPSPSEPRSDKPLSLRTPHPPPGRRPTPGRRPPTHPPPQPVPSSAGLDLPRTGPAHQGPRRRLGPRTGPPLPTAAAPGPGHDPADLAAIPYLPDDHGDAAARNTPSTSIASLDGAAVEELVRDQVRQLRDSRRAAKTPGIPAGFRLSRPAPDQPPRHHPRHRRRHGRRADRLHRRHRSLRHAGQAGRLFRRPAHRGVQRRGPRRPGRVRRGVGS